MTQAPETAGPPGPSDTDAAPLETAAGWLGAALSDASSPHDAVAPDAALIRLLAAVAFGALIGLDRERKERPAGLRTHMLVSLAAAVFTIAALEVSAAGDRLGPNLRVDPTRVVEAVTAGVAFIAAGTIFRAGDRVKGVTTGAAMWLAGAVGVSCGLGYIWLAAAVAAAALLVLVVIRAFEA